MPIRTKPEIYRLLKRLKEWNHNYYIAAIIGIQWGLRCSDILALQVGDVVAGEGTRIQIIDRVMVQEIKTRRERHILITDDMKDVLHGHIKGMGRPLDMDAPLVLSRNRSEEGGHKPLSRQRLWAVLATVAADLDIKGPIGTHSLRKTWAYQAWKDGIRIDVIQKEFGHVDLSTTHDYACIPDTSRDEIYESVNFAVPTTRRRSRNRNGPRPRTRHN